MTEMPPRARAAPSEARGSPINVDQSLARNGCVVVELEAPKGAGRGILEFKDCNHPHFQGLCRKPSTRVNVVIRDFATKHQHIGRHHVCMIKAPLGAHPDTTGEGFEAAAS